MRIGTPTFPPTTSGSMNGGGVGVGVGVGGSPMMLNSRHPSAQQSQPQDSLMDPHEFPALGGVGRPLGMPSGIGGVGVGGVGGGMYAPSAVGPDFLSRLQQSQAQQQQQPQQPPQRAVNFTPDDFPALGAGPSTTSSSASKNRTVALSLPNGGTSSSIHGMSASAFPPLGAPSQQQQSNHGTLAHHQRMPSQQQQQPLELAQSHQQEQELAYLQQQSSQSTTPLPSGHASATGADGTGADRFGLMGLLGVIRMTDQDLNTLALGCDLTTLGLNLNSADPLYTAFLSPWSEQPTDINNYVLPACYAIRQSQPATLKISLFSDETLFYIFYAMPRDELQEHAAQELYNRNWRFHKDLKVWLTKDSQGLGLAAAATASEYVKTATYEKGLYVFFDVSSWSKVSKEFVLYYEQLEERSTVGTAVVGGGNAAASSGTPASSGNMNTGGLHSRQPTGGIPAAGK